MLTITGTVPSAFGVLTEDSHNKPMTWALLMPHFTDRKLSHRDVK